MKTLIDGHEIVSEAEWLEARRKLLEKEKQYTRLQEEMSPERRNLPWVRVTRDYVFDGANGPETLAELFEGRSQLVVYHFMFGAQDKAGCPHHYLDMVPKGRDENGRGPYWVRRHDEYGQ